MDAPSKQGVQGLAGLMDIARFIACRIQSASNSFSLAAAPMVPQGSMRMDLRPDRSTRTDAGSHLVAQNYGH